MKKKILIVLAPLVLGTVVAAVFHLLTPTAKVNFPYRTAPYLRYFGITWLVIGVTLSGVLASVFCINSMMDRVEEREKERSMRRFLGKSAGKKRP